MALFKGKKTPKYINNATTDTSLTGDEGTLGLHGYQETKAGNVSAYPQNSVANPSPDTQSTAMQRDINLASRNAHEIAEHNPHVLNTRVPNSNYPPANQDIRSTTPSPSSVASANPSAINPAQSSAATDNLTGQIPPATQMGPGPINPQSAARDSVGSQADPSQINQQIQGDAARRASDYQLHQSVPPKKKRSKVKLLLGLFMMLFALAALAGGGVFAYTSYLKNKPSNVVATALINTLDGYPLNANSIMLSTKTDTLNDLNTLITIQKNDKGQIYLEAQINGAGAYAANQLATILNTSSTPNIGFNDITLSAAVVDEDTLLVKTEGFENLSAMSNDLKSILLAQLGIDTTTISVEQRQAALAIVSQLTNEASKSLNGQWLKITGLSEDDSSSNEMTCIISTLSGIDFSNDNQQAKDSIKNLYLDNQFIEAERHDGGQYSVKILKPQLDAFLTGMKSIIDGESFEAGDSLQKLQNCTSSSTQSAPDTDIKSDLTKMIDKAKDFFADASQDDLQFDLRIDDQGRITWINGRLNINAESVKNQLNLSLPQDALSDFSIDYELTLDYNGSTLKLDAANADAPDAPALQDRINSLLQNFQKSFSGSSSTPDSNNQSSQLLNT